MNLEHTYEKFSFIFNARNVFASQKTTVEMTLIHIMQIVQ